MIDNIRVESRRSVFCEEMMYFAFRLLALYTYVHVAAAANLDQAKTRSYLPQLPSRSSGGTLIDIVQGFLTLVQRP